MNHAEDRAETAQIEAVIRAIDEFPLVVRPPAKPKRASRTRRTRRPAFDVDKVHRHDGTPTSSKDTDR